MEIINDVIENETGVYINTIIHPYTQENQDNSKWMITSLDSFKHGMKNSNILLSYEKELPLMTKSLLKNKINSNINQIINVISKSPKSNKKIIIYRGMYEKLNLNVGDKFNHKTLIWGSLHKSYAKNFMRDTTDCYNENNKKKPNGFSGIKGAKDDGSLLIITVPIGTHYFERLLGYDFAPQNPKSEIILNPSLLVIDKILKNHIYCHINKLD